MSNDRFVRWQTHTLSQLSTALALISGLSVGGLGLCLALLREKDFNPTGRYAIVFLVVLACFLISSVAGVGVVITRLLDFRLTARKVRDGKTEEPLTIFGADASNYGRMTWWLFWLMVIFFFAAVIGKNLRKKYFYFDSTPKHININE